MAQLSDAAKAVFAKSTFAYLATVEPDGAPQVTPVWIDVDGDDIVFNTADGRRKVANLRRNPTVGVAVIDPDDPYTKVVSVVGRVVEITEVGADEHIDALARKYLGLDFYPLRTPDERRLKVRIRPERIPMQPGVTRASTAGRSGDEGGDRRRRRDPRQ